MDPRTKDAIREIPELVNQIKAIQLDIASLKEGQEVMKELLRAIKKSVVRKYGEEEK